MMDTVAKIICRVAMAPDRDQLARLRAALWPTASVEEHAQELALILEGKAAVTTPLIIFIAETSDGEAIGFLEIDFAFTCRRLQPSAPRGLYRGGGSSARAIGTRE